MAPQRLYFGGVHRGEPCALVPTRLNGRQSALKLGVEATLLLSNSLKDGLAFGMLRGRERASRLLLCMQLAGRLGLGLGDSERGAGSSQGGAFCFAGGFGTRKEVGIALVRLSQLHVGRLQCFPFRL